jgi:hypothetical protein
VTVPTVITGRLVVRSSRIHTIEGCAMTDKKVVRVDHESGDEPKNDASWKPTAEANGKATTLRLIAAALWLVAIGGEAYGIFGVLRQTPVNMVLLIALIVVIGILAIAGSLLWKKANRLDPARKSDTIRFFVQNQLGAIITVIAFLPLIVLILMNKDMSKNQKALAGGIGVVVMLVATTVGIDWNPPSVEQYTEESNQVENATGRDLVYWTKEGKVFHLCEDVSAVNLESKDNKIYSGTVADAHAAGKERLTLQVEQERKQCGFDTPADDVSPGAGISPGAETTP